MSVLVPLAMPQRSRDWITVNSRSPLNPMVDTELWAMRAEMRAEVVKWLGRFGTILVPMHSEAPDHWTLAALSRTVPGKPGAAAALVYDSLSDIMTAERRKAVLKKLKGIAAQLWPGVTVQVGMAKGVPQQPDESSNCALYCLQFAFLLSTPPFDLSRFPAVSRREVALRLLKDNRYVFQRAPL